MEDRSDEALMQAYAGGDLAAFERLYARHRGPLYRYILRQVGDAGIANDLYQGSWEKIIRARDHYTARAPFKAWMFRIAHNHVVDHFRRLRPAADLPQTDGIASDGPGPEGSLLGEETAARLAAAVQNLPAEQREVVLLRLEGGFDLDTIAGLTGVNPETAKSRLRYAVVKLRAALGSLEDGAGS
jgi:RNA polymerase sigma-70 factor (ECF subfamily)